MKRELSLMNRDTVKKSFIEKQSARHILQYNIAEAKHNLSPKTITKKWVDKKKNKLKSASHKSKEIAKNNIPAISIGFIAASLFLLRKPISNYINPKISNFKLSKLRNK